MKILLGAVLGSALATSNIGYAKSTVIHDSGGQAIRFESSVEENSTSSMSQIVPSTEQAAKMFRNSLFPIKTSMMSPGRVTPEEGSGINHVLHASPVFFIGYDPVSIHWMRENRILLQDRQAVGYVVNVGSESQLDELASILENRVLLQPVPGNDIAKQLNIRHYPFYMDRNGVMR